MTIKSTEELQAAMVDIQKRLMGALELFGDTQAYRVGHVIRGCLDAAEIRDPRAAELHAVVATSGRTLTQTLYDALAEAEMVGRSAQAIREHVQKSGRIELARTESFKI